MVSLTIHFPDARDLRGFHNYYFNTHYPLCLQVPIVRSTVWSEAKTQRMYSQFEFADEEAFVCAVATRAGQDVFWDTFKMSRFFFPRFQQIKLGGSTKNPMRLRLRLYGLCVLFLLRWYK